MSFTNSFSKIIIMANFKLPMKKDRKKVRRVSSAQLPFAHVTDELLLETYTNTNFNKSETAQALGMSRSTLNIRINNSPHLQEMMLDAREEVLDIAESQLLAHVKKGNLNAIKFLLERQGRSRGYGVNIEVNNKNTLESLDIGEDMTIEDASRAYSDTLVDVNFSAEDL